MTNSANKRQSHGLTLPQSSDSRDSVVSNIISSLATLDETAQLQWVQETSRKVDHERAYQRKENDNNHMNLYERGRYDGYDDSEDITQAPVTGVGYRERQSNGSLNIPLAAPSPAVPMGRPSKQGFFRRFMGIGPKVPIESEVLIGSTHYKPRVLVKNSHSAQVDCIMVLLIDRLERLESHQQTHLVLLRVTYQKNLVQILSKRSLPASLDVVQRLRS
jgi:hypothetical protein